MASGGWEVGGPAIAIVADSDGGRARCERAVYAVGGVIVAPVAADLLLIDLRRESAHSLDRRLAKLSGDRKMSALILVVPFELIDAADAALGEGGDLLLCDPSDVDLAAALCLASPTGTPLVREASVRDEAERFQRLAEDIGRIGRALTRLSQAGLAHDSSRLGEALDSITAARAPIAPERIREVIRLRKLRSRFFAPDLFADPAWDIFLDLMAAQLEGEEVSVSSLCIAAAVPPSTGLRWIGALTAQGLLQRRADPADRRRVFVELRDGVVIAMERYFAAIEAAFPPAI